jgi:hypothetical protein
MYIRAPSYLKWSYVMVVLSAILPIGLANSGWVSLATGGPSLGGRLFWSIAIIAIGLYRVFLVLKLPGTLDAPEMKGFCKVVRKIGVFLLVLGAFIGGVNIISIPVLLAVEFRHTSDAPVFFIVGVLLSKFIGLGLLGLTMFELSRLLGFEQHARQQYS